MIQEPILEVVGVGKAYRAYNSEFDRILSWFGIDLKPEHETWTLKDINFSICPGEAIGIIGQNGAGKSTLLKIITGTLKPSTGSVTVRGKIAAILELGMGFHPDLTGRQNAYHSAGLMGYSLKQIDSVIAEIESFADIGDYFEQSVRTYSSGMQARVAFAVATAFRPDILIVDEALSVGDIFFGLKCIEKMEEFQSHGTSILLVTHDMGALRRFCSKGILLENGQKVFEGDVLKAVSMYSLQGRTLNDKKDILTTGPYVETNEKSVIAKNINYTLTHFSEGYAEVKEYNIYDALKNKSAVFEQDTSLHFECVFNLLKYLTVPYFHISIINSQNLAIYAKNSFQHNLLHKQAFPKDSHLKISGKIELALAPGKYVFAVSLHNTDPVALELKEHKLVDYLNEHRKVILSAKFAIEIITKKDGLAFYGITDLPAVWKIENV